MSAVQHFPPAHMIPDEEEEAQESQHTVDGANNNTQTQQKQPLALPASPSILQQDQQQSQQQNPNSTTTTTNIDISTGANTVKLDHLGPMVLNTDGTLSRIHNWAEMTEGERERIVKVLGKRNRSRLAVLKDAEEGS